MLAIRMQRTGRSGHAQYRVIVQDSRFSPKSGRIVAYLGSYNPHTKETNLDAEKATAYLSNGAQPSGRVIRLLKDQKVKFPGWVQEPGKKERTIRNPEKLRRNRPAEAEQKTEEASSQPAAAETGDAPAAEAPAVATETPEAAEAPAETPTAEAESAEETPPNAEDAA